MQLYNKELMRINYKVLKNYYGSHKRVAEGLGISVDHYRKIRNNRTVMSLPLRKLIILTSNQIMSGLLPVSP